MTAAQQPHRTKLSGSSVTFKSDWGSVWWLWWQQLVGAGTGLRSSPLSCESSALTLLCLPLGWREFITDWLVGAMTWLSSGPTWLLAAPPAVSAWSQKTKRKESYEREQSLSLKWHLLMWAFFKVRPIWHSLWHCFSFWLSGEYELEECALCDLPYN